RGTAGGFGVRWLATALIRRQLVVAHDLPNGKTTVTSRRGAVNGSTQKTPRSHVRGYGAASVS
ncbi:MAG: hypothetical protein ACUVQG_15175, partial [Thermogutta sp.]